MSKFEALRTAIECRNYEEINEITSGEADKINVVRTPNEYENYVVDELANVLIPFDIPWPNQDVCAIKTEGNGNCLYNSISFLLCQSTALASTLRLLTAAELFMNASKYACHPKFEHCIDLPQITFTEANLWAVLLRDDASSRMNITRKEAVEIEAATTAKNFTWSGMLDIFALATVLKTKIYCCYPEECNQNIRPLLSGCVEPLSAEMDKNLMFMLLWSRDGTLDNTQPYEPNHFVPVIYLRPEIRSQHTETETSREVHTDTDKPPYSHVSANESQIDEPPPVKMQKLHGKSHLTQKSKGAGRYKTKFNKHWCKDFPEITVGTTPHHFWCSICRVERPCFHMGKADVQRHVNSPSHQQKINDVQTSQRVTNYAEAKADLEMKKLEKQVRRAEVKIAACMAKHNIPLAFADHLSPLLGEIFTDSEIAKKFSSAKTKTTCIINGALKPHFQQHLVEFMQQSPFTLSIDGSNDTGLLKMNPITIKIFDCNEVRLHFLDMCTTSGTQCGKAETIFNKMDSILLKHNVPWENCIAVSVDNASVNLGVNNSISSRIKEKNGAVYFLGCPCHILHNNASKAADSFSKAVKFDIEDFCVDVSYWFDKSSNRKGALEEFCVFCDTKYKEILMYAATRWLSLQSCIDRNLQLYESLKSYFRSNNDSTARFRRLRAHFEDSMTEIYLLFLQSIIPLFTNFNLLLQRGDPSIHILYDQMFKFLKNFMAKLLKPRILLLDKDDLLKVDYKQRDNQLEDNQLSIGLLTRSKLNSLLNEGDISKEEEKKFYNGVRAFLEEGLSYALSHLPFKDEVIANAQFVNFNFRMDSNINQVLYFCERYDGLLNFGTPKEQEKLFQEFVAYQTMPKTDIPQYIWKDSNMQQCLDNDDEDDDSCIQYSRMDMIWGYLGSVRDSLTGHLRFKRLAKVAKLVLTLPHSNADEERVFSFIKINKTPGRNSLDVNETLSSLMTIKMAINEPCYKFEPIEDIIKTSKKVTWEYNKAHKKQE